MKLKAETLTPTNSENFSDFSIDDIGDDHMYTGVQTPLKSDAFEMSNTEKKRKNFEFICSDNGCYGVGHYR